MYAKRINMAFFVLSMIGRYHIHIFMRSRNLSQINFGNDADAIYTDLRIIYK